MTSAGRGRHRRHGRVFLLRPNLPVFGDDGWPLETRGVVASSPGHYLVGLAFQYAFASMLVGRAGRDAEYVVRHLSARRPWNWPVEEWAAAAV